MKLIIKLILVTVLCILNNSCRKRLSETLIEGKVINEKTGEPIENAGLALLEYKNNVINPILKPSFIGTSTSTDANGKYKIKFKSENTFLDYAVFFYSKNNWWDVRFIQSDTIKGIKNRKTNKIDIKVTPIAKLELEIINMNPVTQNDYFEFKIITNNPKIKGYESSWYAQIQPIKLTSWLDAEGTNTIKYSYIKNGITTYKDTTFFASSYEVKKIILKY
jgi:hypothetical protein